jgi:hypothetical protein
MEGTGLCVEYCRILGIVSGRGDGTFDPDGAVTGTEAAKMLLGAIGFDAENGGIHGPIWALSVAVRANQKALFDGLNIDIAQPVSRDDAARLVYNAMNAVMVKYEYVLVKIDGELRSTPKLTDEADGPNPSFEIF